MFHSSNRNDPTCSLGLPGNAIDAIDLGGGVFGRNPWADQPWNHELEWHAPDRLKVEVWASLSSSFIVNFSFSFRIFSPQILESYVRVNKRRQISLTAPVADPNSGIRHAHRWPVLGSHRLDWGLLFFFCGIRCSDSTCGSDRGCRATYIPKELSRLVAVSITFGTK